MPPAKKIKKSCPEGHVFYKSSDCPACPTCEAERKPESGFLAGLSAPARRALEKEGIVTLEKLAEFTLKEILSLHGVGPATIPRLEKALLEGGRWFSEP